MAEGFLDINDQERLLHDFRPLGERFRQASSDAAKPTTTGYWDRWRSKTDFAVGNRLPRRLFYINAPALRHGQRDSALEGRRHRTDIAGSNPSGVKYRKGAQSCRCDVNVVLPRCPRNPVAQHPLSAWKKASRTLPDCFLNLCAKVGSFLFQTRTRAHGYSNVAKKRRGMARVTEGAGRAPPCSSDSLIDQLTSD